MKLLFISNLFPSEREPVRGLDNASLLRWLSRRGIDVRVIALRPRPVYALTGGGGGAEIAREADRPFEPRFVSTPYVPRVGSRCNHHLMRMALRKTLHSVRASFPFDAILCSWLYPDGCAVAALAGEMEAPCVLVCQGTDGHRYLENPVRRKAILEAVKRSDSVITRSGRLKELLVEAGAEPAKVHAVYNGVDTDLFRPGDKAARRRELGLPGEGHVLLYVGNFYDVKNPLLLVRAFARLCERANGQGGGGGGVPEFRLAMIGEGNLRAEIERTARELGCGDTVQMTGALSPGAVVAHMQAADLLCVPSRNEGVPNVILEAFCVGLRVIARDVGGIHEVLREEALGTLVAREDEEAFADAILDALRGKDTADAEAIRARGLNYSWERCAERYEDLLRSAIEKSRE